MGDAWNHHHDGDEHSTGGETNRIDGASDQVVGTARPNDEHHQRDETDVCRSPGDRSSKSGDECHGGTDDQVEDEVVCHERADEEAEARPPHGPGECDDDTPLGIEWGEQGEEQRTECWCHRIFHLTGCERYGQDGGGHERNAQCRRHEESAPVECHHRRPRALPPRRVVAPGGQPSRRW